MSDRIEAEILDVFGEEVAAEVGTPFVVIEGSKGDPGKDGHSPVVTATKSGKTTTISVDGAAIATVEDGADGAQGKDGADGSNGKDGVSPTVSTAATTGGTKVTITDAKGSHEFVVKDGAKGADGSNGKDGTNGKDGADGKPGAAGADGITPHIGGNGNWYFGTTDTGKPSRGATGAKGDTGATGPAGPVGPQGPAGAPGKDGAGMDITGATVGQIAKITAVDASGVPTAWSPVDMPSGGSSFTDDGDGNISVDGATAQSVNRFLQSLTFPGLNFKYLNPMNSGTYSDPYGIKVGSGASLVDTILTKTVPGVYTVYMNRNATDVPAAAAAASSSLRGLVILSQIKKHYAIILLVDQSSNFYVQYIQNDVGGGWKQMPDSSAATNAILYTEQALTDPQKLQARKNIDALGSDAPNIQSYMVITPPNQPAGIGVALSARTTGNDFTLDISDANEDQPTKLVGVKTPIDAETHAATNVEYVKNKIANIPSVTVDEVMSDTSAHAVQNKVIKKYVDDTAGKKLNQTEPVIKEGLTIENTGGFAVRVQPDSLTSATGEDFASLDFSDASPQASGSGIVLSGLANFGDAEAVGLENTAVSYAQLIGYTTPLTLIYANGQATGASYTEIRKAIERGRQIKLAVANLTDIIATNAKNEADRSVLTFTNTIVSGDTIDFTQYNVTAQASGITVHVKSMELP